MPLSKELAERCISPEKNIYELRTPSRKGTTIFLPLGVCTPSLGRKWPRKQNFPGCAKALLNFTRYNIGCVGDIDRRLLRRMHECNRSRLAPPPREKMAACYERVKHRRIRKSPPVRLEFEERGRRSIFNQNLQGVCAAKKDVLYGINSVFLPSIGQEGATSVSLRSAQTYVKPPKASALPFICSGPNGNVTVPIAVVLAFRRRKNAGTGGVILRACPVTTPI